MTQAPAHKDYYSLLQVNPNASMQQIKKAYRQLAFRFHPDTTPDEDALSSSIFRDITEAYQVLSDADLRRSYDKDNYYTSSSVFYKNLSEWNRRLLFLTKYVQVTDPYRINRDGICFCIEILLEPNYLFWLKNEDPAFQQKTLTDLLFVCKPLTSDQCKKIASLLNSAFSATTEQQKIKLFLNQQQKKEQWQGYKVLIALIATVLSCLLIIIFTKN